jgi:hypothetical protein
MYKIVTHSIREEHFGHPMTAEIGIATHSNAAPHIGENIVTSSLLAGNLIMLRPRSVEFRMNIRSLFSRFFWRVRDYLISVLDSRESSDVEAELYKNIEAIGSFIETYYGATTVNSFNNTMKDIIKNLIFIVRDIKSDKDITESRNKLSESIGALSMFLNSINPSQWPYSAVFDIFSDLSNNWIAQISARKYKDWIEDMQLVDKNEDIMLSGDVSTGVPPFSDIFAKGIISQFQERFM